MEPARKQLRPSEATPPKSLAERFEESLAETKALAEELVQDHVQYLKQCHPSLPLEVLMAGATKYRDCRCVVALEVATLEKQRAELEKQNGAV